MTGERFSTQASATCEGVAPSFFAIPVSTEPGCASAPAASGNHGMNAQHQMVALPRGVFEGGGNVALLQQRVVGENLSAVGAGGQQVEHVTDADAQVAQARPTPALTRIDGDPVGLAHLSRPDRRHSLLFRQHSIALGHDHRQETISFLAIGRVDVDAEARLIVGLGEELRSRLGRSGGPGFPRFRSVTGAAPRSARSPQMPAPVTRIAPKPRRWTARSPPMLKVP